MKSLRTTFHPRRGFGVVGLLAAHAAFAQTIPPAEKSDDTAVVLSPFVVSSEQDTGYAATDSLAGTRLKTPLKDIAASISVVTKDLLSDLGATNADQLLVYTTGTEVGGVAGNFSNSTNAQYSQDFENQRRSPDSDTRLRGLASADRTRNYFGSLIPMDSYNTQSVTINRGANAILFGLGSPAGIIETTTEKPSFYNRNEVQFRFGSYDSGRLSADFDRVLIDRKLALRLSALEEKREFEQQPAYRDQRRIYGALEFRPLPRTTLRVNAEAGEIEQRLPRIDPPVDAMSSWWQFGQPERATTLFDTANANYQSTTNLSGAAGNWFDAPSLLYASPTATTPSDGFASFSRVGNVRYTYLVPRSSKDVALVAANDPVTPFTVSKQMTDRSVFDYRKQMIDGPNSRLNQDFDAYNIALEQLFLKGDAGLEFVFDRQESETAWYDTFYTWRGNTLYIDPNRETVYGAPNPNFGRPFISGGGGWSNYVEREQENTRVTGFVQHDFRKDSAGWLHRLLGRHVMTGFYTDSSNTRYLNSGPSAAVAPTYYSGRNQNTLETDRSLGTVVFLGPSLAGAPSPAGAGLQGVQVDLMPASTAALWTNNPRTGNRWERQTHDVHTFLDYEWLARNTNFDRTDVKSFGFVWQGDWANHLLVSTVGWRRDEVESASAVQTVWDPVTGARPLEAPALPAPLTADSNLVSYGFALHVPLAWTRTWPGRPRVSLYYNQSENFDIAAVRQTVLGDPLPPQSGQSEEVAIGVSLFDNKLSFRATWYETDQINISDPRFNATALVRAVDMELRIMESNTQAELDAVNYVGWNDPGVSALYKKYLETYSWQVSDTPNADGTVDASYIRAPGATEPTSSISRGMEFEAIYNPTRNWRIMVNAARQKAERGEGASVQRLFLEERLAEWSRPEVAALSAGSTTNTVGAYRLSSFAPYQQAVRSGGQPASELREWRANLITNYAFSQGSKLQGWAIGGALRWQDAVAIGFPVLAAEDGTLYEDVHRPFMGDEDTKLDAWLSYSRPLFNDRIKWKVQLNVRNLLNDGLLIPVRANPIAVGDLTQREIAAWRIGQERTWEITSTFKF